MRSIHALSRFDETPESVVVELVDGDYVCLGSEAALAEREAEKAVFDHLPALEAEAKTFDEIQVKTEVAKTVLRDTLNRLTEEGQIARIGTGKKGAAYRWWLPTDPQTGPKFIRPELHP